MENIISFEGKVKKKMGRPPAGEEARGLMLTVRVTEEEKEVIKEAFGSFDKMRDFVLEVVKGNEYSKAWEKASRETIKETIKKAVSGGSSHKGK